MLQDKAYNNIKYYFQTQSNLEKFNEIATVLQKNGIHNWDEGLQFKNESDLIELGVDEKYAHIFVNEVKRQNQFNNDLSDFSDIASMASYTTSQNPRKFLLSQDKTNQQYYTEEIIERELNKIYEVWQEVNDEFFNQFPDLTRIIFLNFISQEKMLIYGGIHSSNVEELFRAFSKFVDYKKLTHFITPNTNVEELFDKQGFATIPQADIKTLQNTQATDIKVNEANFLLLHQIFQSSSPLINAIIRHLSENDKLTTYATTEQDQPSIKQFDNQILEEFLFTYFEEAEKPADQKKDNFEEFVQAMWTKNGQNGKIVAPQKFLKGAENSKLGGANPIIPNAFKKPQLKLTQEFLTALGDLAFQKVEDSTGILKLYLKELRERLLDNKILISQRRWVRIFRVLKIVAYTRNIGDTSRVSLADCFIVPFLMAKSKSEFTLIEKTNLDVIENLARFYGSLKLSHYIEKHFWLLSPHKAFIKQIKKRHSHLPSFFQGCISHPDYFQIFPEVLQQQKYSQLCYQVSGPDRKMLSDDFFAIDVNKAYEMKLDIKTSNRMIVYIGLVCFDENKEFIHSTQVCRVENSEVIITGDDESTKTLLVSSGSEANLKKWNSYSPEQKDKQKNFAYLRSIGFYYEGDTFKLIPISAVIQDNVKPYDTTEEHGAFSEIKGNRIYLTDYGWKKYQQLKEKGVIQFNKTQLMNHFEGGTYTFAECFDDYIKKWMQKSFWFKGETRSTETNKFRKGTKYVKIVILSNYNSGFPDFKILQKDASIYWKNIEFNYLK
ncbi:hypothetical protein ABPG74_017170 [Tetrahymena malaccensis]